MIGGINWALTTQRLYVPRSAACRCSSQSAYETAYKMRLRNLLRRLQHPGPLLDYYRFASPFPKARIREYADTDFDRCSEIYARNEPRRFPEGYFPKYQEYLRNHENLFLVIEDESAIVGSGAIVLKRYTDTFTVPELVFGMMDPSFHGMGYGTLLFCARLCFLVPHQDWHLSMTSAGNGTEIYYKKLGFQFIQKTEPMDGHTLDFYQVKVLSADLRRFRKMITAPNIGMDLDLGTPIPMLDHREAFREAMIAKYGTEHPPFLLL